ncbi:MAG: hypothetical protein ABI690_26040 [Chloroflexota bacterium]
MKRRFIPLLFLLFSITWAAVSAQDCPALVKNALSRAQTACAILRGNQACYGYPSLDAKLQKGLSPFAFNGVGDITPIDTIESLHMSAFDPVKDQWGVTLMRVRADISPDMPNQNVTLLAFGEVSIDPDRSGDYQPMQAFALQTGDASSGCTNITENGLIIQTPEGVGRVTLWINDVRIRVGSTVLFQAEAGGDLVVSTFEGHAEVQADGGTQEATTGMRVRVPMDANLKPAGVPTIPEPFDAVSTGLVSSDTGAAESASLLDVTSSYTTGTVADLIPTGGSSGSGSAGSASDTTVLNADGTVTDQSGDCNGDHGQGAANGNCFGQANGNNGNAGGNGNGNAGGNDNDNAGGNGNGNAGGNGNGNGNVKNG